MARCRVPDLTRLIPVATRKQDEILPDLKKDFPDGLYESQENSNMFYGVIWGTAYLLLTNVLREIYRSEQSRRE
jgi:hypothetical protein